MFIVRFCFQTISLCHLFSKLKTTNQITTIWKKKTKHYKHSLYQNLSSQKTSISLNHPKEYIINSKAYGRSKQILKIHSPPRCNYGHPVRNFPCSTTLQLPRLQSHDLLRRFTLLESQTLCPDLLLVYLLLTARDNSLCLGNCYSMFSSFDAFLSGPLECFSSPQF